MKDLHSNVLIFDGLSFRKIIELGEMVRVCIIELGFRRLSLGVIGGWNLIIKMRFKGLGL